MPAHIWRGMVRCSKPAKKNTTTTSSNDVMKANSPPEMTPGRIRGMVILKKVRGGGAPRPAAARTRVWSKPTRVAVTVITTNGVPSAVWARISPGRVWARPSFE